MAIWLHPMVNVLRALKQAPNGRPMHSARIAGTTLQPLLRVWGEEVTGVPARLARHEFHHLPGPKFVLPGPKVAHAITNSGQSYLPADVLDGALYQEARSQKRKSNDGIFSAREVVNALRRIRYDRSPQIPIGCVARAAGLSRMTVYRVIWSGTASVETRAALSPLLWGIADDTVGFERRARKWECIELRPWPQFNPLLPRQDKIVPARDYVDGACCRTCGGWRYTRVTLHGAPAEYFLCDGCLWWETASLGARPVEARRRSRSQRSA